MCPRLSYGFTPYLPMSLVSRNPSRSIGSTASGALSTRLEANPGQGAPEASSHGVLVTFHLTSNCSQHDWYWDSSSKVHAWVLIQLSRS